ncbi:MAG: DUF3303 family protein [Rubrivivax sp.]
MGPFWGPTRARFISSQALSRPCGCAGPVTLLEAPDLETVQRLQAPFAPYTETTIVPVQEISGWTAS